MKNISLLLVILLLHCRGLNSQPPAKIDLKVVFYNVENFYDWENDSSVNDEEFLPEGSRRWTKYRFEEKAVHLFQVFAAIGEKDFPDIIGMAEVENAFVLDYLCHKTPMKKIPMGMVHRDSPDPRGIDACMLYRMDKLKLLRSEFIHIKQKNGQLFQTRDIVYASFETRDKDVLHVFVNHWPSRRGGEMETQEKRNLVAGTLRSKVDSLFKADFASKIVIIGDFNDEPFNKSITKVLKTQTPGANINGTSLYNLSTTFYKNYRTGTLKFKGNWSIFDQIIISGALMEKKNLYTYQNCAGVFNQSFLLSEDKSHMGYMPWRTYNGLTYSGGYSDHLPVYLNLYFQK